MKHSSHISIFSSSFCRSVLATAFIGLTALGAHAQWQWMDKDGRKVFSDRPPPADVLEKNILKRPGGRPAAVAAPAPEPAATAAAPQSAASGAVAQAAARPASAAGGPLKLSGVDKELEEKKKKAADAEAVKRTADAERVAKVKADNCARARQSKTTFESGVRIARTDAKGERQVLEDADRAKEVKRIEGIISSDCLGG